MQSEKALRKLGELDRDLIEQRVHRAIDLRVQGDWRGLVELAAEDISFDLRGNWTAFPYSKPVHGKIALAQALITIIVQFESLGSIVNDLVIDGDRVAVRRTARLRNRGSGKIAEVDVADFIRFRDGLIVEFTEIADWAVLSGPQEG
ncbi:nuclear transport factor 2 family protein [Rhodoblastus sp.]|uniref:nuclear transport factor 2 family protein n=1 Tax=Rhodoblastus sp. TaxID=1962975 RepID=UPI003F9E29E1